MRVNAEQLLHKLAREWGPVLDWSHNGIVVIDADGTIVAYNRAARRIFNDGQQQLVGRPMAEVRPETWPELAKVAKTGRPQIGKRIEMPQATIIANRNPIWQDGRIMGVFSVFQDISEYEAIISELQGYRKLHRQMEAILENSHDGLYIADGGAKTLGVNQAYEKITGLNRADLIGRNMSELEAAGIIDHSVTLEVLKRGTQVNLMQKVKGGKQLMVTGTPILDETGEIVQVVTNVRDMTALNRLQAELEESRRIASRARQSLMEQDSFEHALTNLVVKSNPMAQVVRKAVKVAEVAAPVLLYGESGVGKSMLARVIHDMSPRKEEPFVKINCGAIPASLMESELFGYVKGAFTGADPAGKAGLLQAGHKGTVFFDEVGELAPALQVKLLQVIEDQTFVRVGSTKPQTVDVKIIAATNRDLAAMLKDGRFRNDLYYRLNVVPITLPPLRERREDIPPLALTILEKFNQAQGKGKRLSPAVMDRLTSYAFPGNVRELFNIVERMLIMSEGAVVDLEDLPAEVREDPLADPVTEGLTLKQAVEEFESRLIARAVRRHGGVGRAARALGVHPSTLWRKAGRLAEEFPLKNAI